MWDLSAEVWDVDISLLLQQENPTFSPMVSRVTFYLHVNFCKRKPLSFREKPNFMRRVKGWKNSFFLGNFRFSRPSPFLRIIRLQALYAIIKNS